MYLQHILRPQGSSGDENIFLYFGHPPSQKTIKIYNCRNIQNFGDAGLNNAELRCELATWPVFNRARSSHHLTKAFTKFLSCYIMLPKQKEHNKQSKCTIVEIIKISGMRDSNSRPLGPKPSALAIWANPRLDLNWQRPIVDNE